jgi:hypothetical protein
LAEVVAVAQIEQERAAAAAIYTQQARSCRVEA